MIFLKNNYITACSNMMISHSFRWPYHSLSTQKFTDSVHLFPHVVCNKSSVFSCKPKLHPVWLPKHRTCECCFHRSVADVELMSGTAHACSLGISCQKRLLMKCLQTAKFKMDFGVVLFVALFSFGMICFICQDIFKCKGFLHLLKTIHFTLLLVFQMICCVVGSQHPRGMFNLSNM